MSKIKKNLERARNEITIGNKKYRQRKGTEKKMINKEDHEETEKNKYKK